MKPEPPGQASSAHVFSWTPASVAFRSEDAAGATVAAHTFTDAIPPAGGEAVHVNLWLTRPRGPTDGQEIEVIVRRFSFVPASTP